MNEEKLHYESKIQEYEQMILQKSQEINEETENKDKADKDKELKAGKSEHKMKKNEWNSKLNVLQNEKTSIEDEFKSLVATLKDQEVAQQGKLKQEEAFRTELNEINEENKLSNEKVESLNQRLSLAQNKQTEKD